MTKEGSIEVITGCMFSGKTEEMLRRLRRVEIARQKFQLFKPSIDTRYGGHNKVISHSGNKAGAISIDFNHPEEILSEAKEDTEVIAIDEVQFFSSPIIDVISRLAEQGKRVIVAGLDLDFRGEPFGSMPPILAIAEKIDKLTAICEICGREATRTQRLIDDKPASFDAPIVLIAGADKYVARDRRHHQVLNKPK